MQEIELDIEDIAQGGAGVGRWNGRTIFAQGGLPGEHVRVRFTPPLESSSTRAYAFAQVIEVMHASPDRIAPRLPNAGHIPWQHIAYEAQLRYKEHILRDQLERLAGLDHVALDPIIPARQPWGYRNSANLHVQEKQIGYCAPGTQQVVDLHNDPLLLPAINEALAGLRSAYAETPTTQLTSVTLRASDAFGYAIAALEGTNLPPLIQRWKARVPSLVGVSSDPPNRQPNNDPQVTLHEELDGIIFSLSPNSFFQVHTAQAQQLLTTVREGLRLTPQSSVLDAYSGVGTFALPLAAQGQRVLAIEENPHAVADGERSAQLNAIEGVRFQTAPVERALQSTDEHFDRAILDPPRRGCHPAALAALIERPPHRIAYISCHPGILARDLRILLTAGYTIEIIKPLDLFPQTPHIECVVFLRWNS